MQPSRCCGRSARNSCWCCPSIRTRRVASASSSTSSGFPRARTRGSRGWRCAPMRRSFRRSSFARGEAPDTWCTFCPSWKRSAPETCTPTSSPPRRASPRCSRRWCDASRNSGCGCTSAGRRARRVSSRSTDASMSLARRMLAALAVCVTLVACRTAAPPNVVVVLVDTLRPDFLGCYGHPAGLTPFVDELAASGTRFGHAYAASTWTNPSVASLFTSRWQSQTGVMNLFSVLPARERTLAEALHERGFATAAFLATRSIPGAAGFGQGFEVWEEVLDQMQEKGTGAQLNQRTLAWLDARPRDDRRPLLLYLHYMEPHFPYDPRPDRLDAVLAPRHYTEAERDAWDARVNTWLEHSLVGGALPDDVGVMHDEYLAEVASLDQALRELFDGLRTRGVLEHAVVVMTADHGEEFFEHGLFGHGLDLFDETLRVPLLLLVPGRRPEVLDEPVSLIDVAPTVLELVGARAEPAFEGQSLLRRKALAPAYAELLVDVTGKEPPQNRALVAGSRKIMLTPDGGEQFYDLARDPGERDPDAFDGQVRTELVQALDASRARAQRDVSTAEQRKIDDATRERLRALGYAN